METESTGAVNRDLEAQGRRAYAAARLPEVVTGPAAVVGWGPATVDREAVVTQSRFTQGALAPLLLVLVVLATRIPFVYSGGMPEPDSVVMAAGMVRALAPDLGVGDATLYGRQQSPAMYVLVDRMYPLLFGSPGHMIAFLNWLAVIAAALLMWPLYALMRAAMPAHAAAGAALVVAFSPVVWDFGTFFHPLVPACFMLLVAMACAGRVSRSPGGRAWLAVALVSGALAVVIRAEVLFIAPGILLWSVLNPVRRGRNAALAFGAVAFALVCYGVVMRLLAAATAAESRGVRGYVSLIHDQYISTFSLRGLDRSATWMVLSMGCASVFAVLWALGRRAATMGRRRRWSERHAWVVASLAWILPSVCFWLPQPTPIVRHYVLATIGVGWLAGFLVLRPLSPRRAALAAAIIIAANLVVPEAAYRTYNAAHSGHEKSPNGAFFYEHEVQRGVIERHRRMARDVVAAARVDGAAVLVDWTGYAYMVYALYAGAPPATRVGLDRDNPNVSNERFRIDDHAVWVVQGIRLTPGSEPARRAADYLSAAAREGLTVFVPSEAAGAGLSAAGLGFDVTTY